MTLPHSRFPRTPLLWALLLCAGGLPAPLPAQEKQLGVEVSVLRGTIGYAWPVGANRLMGAELGFGFPQIDQTFVPRQLPEDRGPSFEEYLHLGLFLRTMPSSHVDVDVGARLSFTDLYDSSGVWPEPFVGAWVQPMLGGDRLKVGMRLVTGVIFEPDAGPTGVLSLNPFLVRWVFHW